MNHTRTSNNSKLNAYMNKDGLAVATIYRQYHYSFAHTAYNHNLTDQYSAGHHKTIAEHLTYIEAPTPNRH